MMVLLSDAALSRATCEVDAEDQCREDQQPSGLATRRATGTETLEQILCVMALVKLSL